MVRLKDYMTEAEYNKIRNLQLELLRANSKKEALLIKGEIDEIIQRIKMRYKAEKSDKNTSSS
ncbi:hypothetical protein SAMN05877753_102532 [Bacillus oleivorans]|uniref:Uncharacterized protein n=1 Tax=Bacillus oleivorans TaxID=1448271 RepID=A0A285CLN2_9BACI|nr:hypothetical protein [Bacillus oleivorans]SNX68441.1 hypothetical protein SAMN05877753_102532 [Bacillus oleivorans]